MDFKDNNISKYSKNDMEEYPTLYNYDRDEWEIDGTTLLKHKRENSDIRIPEGVEIIDLDEFASSVVSVITIPSSVTKIVEGAFIGIHHFNKITVRKGNTKFHVAGNCLIETESKTLILGGFNAIIPTDGSVTRIGNGAFCARHKLSDIVIPDSVVSIGENAFYCCKLENVEFGKGVSDIANGAFRSCSNLGKISVSKDNPKYHSAGNCLIETATKTLVVGCSNSVIPTDGTVTRIGERAFEGCIKLSSIVIGDSIVSIGANAFLYCGLESVKLGKGVTEIGGSAFQVCTKLTDVVIADSVVSIGRFAFADCRQLERVKLGKGVKHIGDSAFLWCKKLTDISLPSNVVSIGSCAFFGCEVIKNIKIPNSVTRIDTLAFYKCSALTKVTIPERFKKECTLIFDSSNIQFKYI